ncbi:hypothetical protein [Flavobacterium sp. GCM10023249]|uniref:hypothetical protein n=1 Tax=unclassified Flavobacterium TaxID=196869 RepID=UPI00360D4B0A
MYSLTKIKQTSDCDAVLNWAQKERAVLAQKKSIAERAALQLNTTAEAIEEQLQRLPAEIEATETVIGWLPDGPLKEAELKRKFQLQYKKFQLESRKESQSFVALVKKEVQVQLINKKLKEYDAFIAALNAHRATLPN